MRRQTGFTLIEILVVIAIISVLAALLLPVYSKTKHRAFLTEDISQMRQVFAAVSMYEQDQDDKSPSSLTVTLPYSRSTQVYTSPADPFRHGIPGIPDFPANISAYGDPTRASFRISYAYLWPVAKAAGFDETWTAKVRDDPAYGLISLFMYNDPFGPQGQSQFDLWRWKSVNYRICMDGSLKTAHGEFGVSDGCNVDSCFGLIAD